MSTLASTLNTVFTPSVGFLTFRLTEETFSWNEEIPPMRSLQVSELSQAVKRWLLITRLPEPIIGSSVCLVHLWFGRTNNMSLNSAMRSPMRSPMRSAMDAAQSLTMQALAILRSFGSDAHVYLPGERVTVYGPDVLNGRGSFDSASGVDACRISSV